MSYVFNMVGGGSGGSLKDTDAILTVTVPTGSTVTMTKGGVTLTPTMWVQAADNTLDCALFVIAPINFGSWIVLAALSGNTDVDIVNISSNKQYDLSLDPFLPSTYQRVEYIAVASTAGPRIATGYYFTTSSEFEVKLQFIGEQNNNSWAFGAYAANKATDIGFTSNAVYMQVGMSYITMPFDTDPHIFKATSSKFYVDGVEKTGGTPNWANTNTNECQIFYNLDGARCKNVRFYYAKMKTNGALACDLYPAYRKSDSVPGVYDRVNGAFKTNVDSGTILVGPDV